MKSFSTTVATLALAGSAAAFWRMPCRSTTGIARIDPLVAPGATADHSHIVFGAGNFGTTADYESLAQCSTEEYNCTSCGVHQDKSAYWTPPLYFQHDNGTTEMVPNVGGMLAYYLFYLDDLVPFPEGFQMIAGDPTVRNFTGPFPDEQLSYWPTDPTDQFFLEQRAIGFNCLNYAETPEASLYRHQFPDKDFMDTQCVDGLRLEMAFPSCGTGAKDSTNHKSHVAYPSLVKEGNCPEGFDVHYPFLFFETIYATQNFAGQSGQFLISTGDPVGTSYHGDFIMGWESADFLGQAIETCTDASGEVSDCPLFDLQSDSDAAQCTFAMPEGFEDDDCSGPRDGLPVGVPVQPGPEPATDYPVIGAGATAASSPTSTQASSSAPAYTSAESSAESTTVSATSSTESSSATAAPTTTAAPTYSSATSDDNLTTTYITNGYEVVEMVIVETAVTVTATATAPAYSSSSSTASAVEYSTPSSTPSAPSYQAPSYQHKRHMEKHQRRHL